MPRLSRHRGLEKEVTPPRPLDCQSQGAGQAPQRPGVPGTPSERRSPGLSSGLCGSGATPRIAPSNKRMELEPRPPGFPGATGTPQTTGPAAPDLPAPRHGCRGATRPPGPQPRRRPLTHPAMAALGLRLRRPGPGASIAALGGWGWGWEARSARRSP